MGAAICGCVALIAVLAAIHEQRRLKGRPKTSPEDQNALDRGLALLIKDISRHRDAPVAPRTTAAPMLAPRPGPALRPVSRPARGTPADAVLVATRLRTLPVEPPVVPVMPSAPPPPAPANLFDLFDDDDDDAPTTLASAYVESPSPTTPVRVGRH